MLKKPSDDEILEGLRLAADLLASGACDPTSVCSEVADRLNSSMLFTHLYDRVYTGAGWSQLLSIDDMLARVMRAIEKLTRNG